MKQAKTAPEIIKVIIGLGNPGQQYNYTRHNIGFRIIDLLAEKYNSNWRNRENIEIADISINNKPVLLIKPQSFMNNSGQVVPYLKKQGVKPEEVLVIHDELELPFGKIALKFGGSSKGHNGLKSIIENFTDKFWRLRFGIDRPEKREDVPIYVLQHFNSTEKIKIEELIQDSINLIEQLY